MLAASPPYEVHVTFPAIWWTAWSFWGFLRGLKVLRRARRRAKAIRFFEDHPEAVPKGEKPVMARGARAEVARTALFNEGTTTVVQGAMVTLGLLAMFAPVSWARVSNDVLQAILMAIPTVLALQTERRLLSQRRLDEYDRQDVGGHIVDKANGQDKPGRKED